MVNFPPKIKIGDLGANDQKIPNALLFSFCSAQADFDGVLIDWGVDVPAIILLSTFSLTMIESKPENCDECHTFIRQRENHGWFDTWWKCDALPIIISAVSYLLYDMLTALSPIAESMFVTVDKPLTYLLTRQSSSSDCRPGCSFGHLDDTSGGTSGENAEECSRNPTTTVRKRGIFSSTVGAASAISKAPISVGIIKRALLTRNLDSTVNERKEHRIPPVDEVIVEPSSEQNQIPDAKAVRGQYIRKRKGTREKCDDISETTKRKKTKRTVDLQQIRKHERKGRQWAKMFQMLLEYKQKYGNTLVPTVYIQNNEDLGKWVAIQRHSFNTNNLPNSRIEMLNSVGFAWNENKPTKKWMQSYKSLVAYKEEHGGSTRVPQYYSGNRKLGFWVHRQRGRFQRNQLSALEIDLLESIGFSWDS